MGLAEGRARRDDGVWLAESAFGAGWDRDLIDAAILHLARTRPQLSANEVRDLLPAVRPPLMGARFLAAARAGWIEHAGTIHATSASRHANRMGLWRSLLYRPRLDWAFWWSIADHTDIEQGE